jgi:hypothetical protein
MRRMRSGGRDRHALVGILAGLVLGALALLAPAVAGADFGIVPGSFEVSFANQDGTPATQAGSHPFQQTTTLRFNQTTDFNGQRIADGQVKDTIFEQPAGLTGDPFATARCPMNVYYNFPLGSSGTCPNDTVIGTFLLAGSNPFIHVHVPVFNLVPPPGVAAQFGFIVVFEAVTVDVTVRAGGGYGLTASVSNIAQGLSLAGSTLTLWGVPADPAHDPLRGTCLNKNTGESLGNCPSGTPPKALLTLPSACGAPLTTTLNADSWENPGVFLSYSSVTPTGLDGCERLDFSPSATIAPESRVAGAPTGLTFDLHVPQNEDPHGLAEALPKKTVVTLPAGMTVNSAAANGLGACTPAEIGLNNAEPASCPDSSKQGTVEVLAPALEKPLEGSVYVAQQTQNPFGSLIALYVVAEGSGVRIKLAGRVSLDPVTGQLTTTFDDLPQQPFGELKLSLFGGSRAPLVNPSCGSYTAGTQLTPYSGGIPVESFHSFAIDQGCVNPQPFAPSFAAGTLSNQAGAFSAFTTTFSRQDGEQDLSGVTVKTPPGLLGILKSVQQCPEPQAGQGTCGAGSLIGHTTATAGAGPDPVSVGGQVFLTGPYKGAPFGLSIVVPAVAGPFNLGTVVIRAAIDVDPHTARIAVTSDPLPTILQGIPLSIKKVNVTIDRSGFIFNPTNCEPLTVDGTLSSAQGASASVSSHFQAANCAALGFHPVFTVSTQAKTSKQNGASLDVKTTYPAGPQANIRSVAVTLPKQLPARLTTIQQACPQAVFAANPASCPAGSNIGTATASTPVLVNPLTGPVYLVSHGGAAFPDVVIVFQGEGITLDLVGSVNIKHGITSSTFASVPDAPIGSFELNLPEGPHSGLAAVVPAKAKGNLCGQSLTMPMTITGQNGAQIKQSTKIAVTGCAKAKKKTKHKQKHRAKKGSLGKRH